MRLMLFASVAAIALVASTAPAQTTAGRDDAHALAVPSVNHYDSIVASPAPTIRAETFRLAAPDTVKENTSLSLERVGWIVLLPFAFAGAVKTISADKDSYPVGVSTRDQLNQLIRDFYYFTQNGVMSSTVATQPLCARGGTAQKVKTTNATVLKENGAAVALAATDDYWTLAPVGVLAVSSFRRFLLLDTAGVASVQASTDAATAAGCTWTNRPAAGTAIVGILTVATDATHTFTPATTALNAAGITATFIDGIDDSVFFASVVTP